MSNEKKVTKEVANPFQIGGKKYEKGSKITLSESDAERLKGQGYFKGEVIGKNKAGKAIVAGLLLALCVGLFTPKAEAAWGDTRTLVVTVSTYAVDGANGLINLSDDLANTVSRYEILNITISADNNTADQTVTLYDNCTTTTTVTSLWEVVIDSNNATLIHQEDFTDRYPMIAQNGLMIRKSSTVTGVKVSILYR